jgi:hypothetical protein
MCRICCRCSLCCVSFFDVRLPPVLQFFSSSLYMYMYVYSFPLKVAAHLFLPTSTTSFFLTASLFAFSWVMYFSPFVTPSSFLKKSKKTQLSLKILSQKFFLLVKTYHGFLSIAVLQQHTHIHSSEINPPSLCD